MTTEIYEFDVLRATLAARVKTAMAVIGVPCEMPNSQFKQPATGPWVKYSLMIGKTVVAEAAGIGGKQLEKTAVVIQFDVFTPEKSGDGVGLLIANKLKRAFNMIDVQVPPVGYFKTDAMSVKSLNTLAPRGFFRHCTDGPLCFWHKNPNA